MSNSGPGSELDSLCIRVGRLRITVEQIAEGSVPAAGSEASFEVVDPEQTEVPLAGESSPFGGNSSSLQVSAWRLLGCLLLPSSGDCFWAISSTWLWT